MTNEERQMIQDIHNALFKRPPGTPKDKPVLIDGLRELHDAFMEVPPGSGPDDRPLLERIRRLVKNYERTSWAARVVVYLTATVGTIAGAYIAIRGIFR